MRHVTEYATAITGKYPSFQNALIFVLEHYLILEAHNFPRALLSGKCSLLETNNVCGQIFEHIFLPNGRYYLCIQSGLVGKLLINYLTEYHYRYPLK